MRKTIIVGCTLLFASSAWAGAKCDKHPKNEWIAEADAKARIQSLGYKISKFKVDGNCYEIYGFDKEGRKAEVYFDTKTLAVVKAEIKK